MISFLLGPGSFGVCLGLGADWCPMHDIGNRHPHGIGLMGTHRQTTYELISANPHFLGGKERAGKVECGKPTHLIICASRETSLAAFEALAPSGHKGLLIIS